MTIRRNTSEVERSRASMLRAVRVAEVDADKALVRVYLKDGKEDEAKSAWLPLINARAGGNRAWHLPDVDEQMMLFAPDGNTESAVLLGGVYSKYGPQPSNDPDLDLMAYKDDASVSYHRGEHQYRVDVPDDGGSVSIHGGATVSIDAGQSVSVNAGVSVDIAAGEKIVLTAPMVIINGNLFVNGNIILTGDFSATGVTHFHGDVIVDGEATIGGIDFSTHEHGGVIIGDQYSDGPEQGE